MARNNDDQTSFQADQPIFEDGLMGSVGEAVRAEQTATKQANKKPFFKTPKGIMILLAGGLLTIILILIILAASLRKTTDNPDDNGADDGDGGGKIERTEFEQKIENLRLELIDADPVKQDVPFPPVESELGLEKE